MPRYQHIEFLDNDDSIEPLRLLDEVSDAAALDYMLEAASYRDEPGEISDDFRAGDGDALVHISQGVEHFIMSYSYGRRYIGLERVID